MLTPSTQIEFVSLENDVHKRNVAVVSEYVANEARFIAGIPKHAIGKENCYLHQAMVDWKPRVLVIASKDIMPG